MSAVFVTATVPHGASMPLKSTLSAVMTAWRSVLTGGAATRWRASTGFVGMLRVVEITHGINGWHPHIHCVMLFERPVTPASVKAWMLPRWAAAVVHQGLGAPSARHGLDARQVTSDAGNGALAAYLTKVEGGNWSAGRELLRADLKTGRWKGRNPSQILAGAIDGSDQDRALYCEFDRATSGRRRVEVTHGLRTELGLGTEATDEEAAIEETATEPLGVVMVPTAIWRRWDEHGQIGELLDAIERHVLGNGPFCDLWAEVPGGPEPPG